MARPFRLKLAVLRLHTEAQLIPVQIIDIEITHAVWVVLRFVQRSGASRFQFSVQGVHVGYEYVNRALTGLPLSPLAAWR
jgi:hypothetical protein